MSLRGIPHFGNLHQPFLHKSPRTMKDKESAKLKAVALLCRVCDRPLCEHTSTQRRACRNNAR